MKKNHFHPRNILILACVGLLVSGCIPNTSVQPPAGPNTRNVEIRGKTVSAVIADEPAEQSKGLSGVESLSDSEGMLFVFNDDSQKSFWMKGMLIPIDIIWINNSEVTGFIKNAQPEPDVVEDELTIYRSDGPADLVLEVRAGFVDEYGIEVGDPVVFK